MSHDEYIKRRDEVLSMHFKWGLNVGRRENDPQAELYDFSEVMIGSQAQQAIDELVLAVIGEDDDRFEFGHNPHDETTSDERNGLRDHQREIVKGDK